jgi:hypothetical protein
MATVTLTGPRRLNIGGVLYKRGEPIEMEDHLAMQFEEDERFRVKGVRIDPDERRERAAARETRPMGDSLLRAINDAIGELDVDDDDAFDRHGKPSIRSISALLGYQITASERDRAMGQAMGKSGQLETLGGGTETTSGHPARGSKLRLTPEQRDALAKKAAAVHGAIPDGNEKAVERQRAAEAEDAAEETVEM